MNLLQSIAPDTLDGLGLTWQNDPQGWQPLPEGGIRVDVPPEVDYFQDPTGHLTRDSAPFLWLAAQGDFVAQARVRPTFTTTYDAGALMVRYDQQHWAKVCFESTDLGSTAVVSVVTNGISDDANGIDLVVPDVWLQVARVGNIFGMHYALDGKSWRMVRFFGLQMPQTVKVGLVAQSPIGPGTTVEFLHLSVEQRSVKNLRAGI